MKIRAAVIGFVNFSVITKSNSAYKAGSKDYQKYKETILNPRRLKLRENIFFSYTVPLIISEHNKYSSTETLLKLCVAYSDLLPISIVDKLKNLNEAYPEIFSVYKVGENDSHSWNFVLDQQLNNIVEKESSIFTSENISVCNFRLDDDDLLSPRYFDSLAKYLHFNTDDLHVTFSRGFVGIYNEGYTSFYKINKPFLAIGLSRLSIFNTAKKMFITSDPCVFGSVSHGKLMNETIAILDSKTPAFIWTFHFYSDTRSLDQSDKVSIHRMQRFVEDNELVEVTRSFVEQFFVLP